MSTLPGLASKGEKGKSKFQSLDINNLYRVTLGENLESKQQKSTLSHKHGMQSLGKVPSARRPPANLPSLKSEHSGTDAAVSLVPSNGPGWGKQETTTSTATTTSTSNSTASSANTSTSQLSSHQAAIALPVTNAIPPPNIGPKSHPISVAVAATGDKSWSAVMTGGDPAGGHPPPYQSPQFQHEFPSLSAGDGAPARSGTDTQYGPGPSLRPQTEGSWMQGGSRGPPDCLQRNSSVSPGAPPQLTAQVGLPPQCRGFVPTFMYRGNNPYPTNGHGTPPLIAQQQQQPPSAANAGNRGRSDHRARGSDADEMSHRPIIKEEDLSGMDNLTGDMGWAMHDDIDYNQKLAFSDDETKPERDTRKPTIRMHKEEKPEVQHLHQQQQHHHHHQQPPSQQQQHHHPHEQEHKTWGGRPAGPPQQQSPQQQQNNRSPRQEEDEMSAQRRRQQQEVQNAVERAKQRKEVEEKKFLETKQAAAKKLQELDEKINKTKRDKDNDETSGTINPAAVPPQTIAPVPILLPEWERERPAKQPLESEEKPKQQPPREGGQSDFRHMTQIEGRNFPTRKEPRGNEKEQTGAPSFSRQFQSNLPPRFQKQQQMNSTTQPNFHHENNRWSSQGGNSKTSPNNRKNRSDLDEKDEDRFRRHGSSDDFRSSHRPYADSGRKSGADIPINPRYDDSIYEYKEGERRHEAKLEFDNPSVSRQNSDEWHSSERRYDRPQRPDSRDSRASRDSRHSGDSARHSEPREYIPAWPETQFEDSYEGKKKEHRMQVPGPITKEKIEADDLRSEKRNLTQLMRGAIPEKKPDKQDDPWNIKKNDTSMAWADSVAPVALENPKFMETEKIDVKVVDEDRKDDRGHGSNRNRSDSQGSRNQGWGGGGGGGNVAFSRNSWSKKGGVGSGGAAGGGTGGRSSRGGNRPPSSAKGGDWHGTESEGSADDNSLSAENAAQRSPKPAKKFEKDDKSKDAKNEKNEKTVNNERRSEKGHRDFVPRGEPSRHGRGGGSSFRGGRGGCKRIDGYGPPTVKSPFTHHDDKDHKSDEHSPTSDQLKNTTTKDYERKEYDRKGDRGRKQSDNRRGKPRVEGELSDNSDESSKDKLRKGAGNKMPAKQSAPNIPTRGGRSSQAGTRLSSEKRGGFGGPSRSDPPNRQNSNGSIRSNPPKEKDSKEINSLASSVTEINLKKDESEVGPQEVETPIQPDADGFQEVKSKKTVKVERPKQEEKVNKPAAPKVDKDVKAERKPKPVSQQLSQQQIANIPSLMATLVNPPANLPQPQNKGQFDRSRQNKLPPRFAKQRENNRLQKAQLHQGMCDVGDINKMNQNMYGGKDGGGVVAGGIANAWEKPLSAQMRGAIDQDPMIGVGMDACKGMEQVQVAHCPGTVNSNEDKAVLDGSKPLNTIIFENTNFKSAPGCRSRNDKPQRPGKLEDGMDTAVIATFNKPIGELLNKADKQAEIQMQLFNKEDTADMKLDFFETELVHLTEDKGSKSIGLPRSIHAITNSNNTMSTADALNKKIQSVKKVWESVPAGMDGVGQDESNSSFSASFGSDPNSLDASAAFSKGAETSDESHEVYSTSPNNQNASNSTTNVCKVKPTQQVAGSTGQAILSTGTHQQHSMVGATLMGHPHPLSPPPMQPLIGSLGQPPQQYTASQHLSYQASLGGTTQFGMPAIPSPPNVMFNSTQQQLQAQTAAGLYAPFQIDQSQVLNSQGRSQYSQYPYGLGQTASSPYSQSVYLQTAQAHAPPTAQAPPDLYQSMNNYRIPGTGPFGQTQQLNNPTTVLISSTSNSLMSASVKPSNQQISAIGTKAGGVGQAYQQQSQQGQQLYMAYDPSMQANYMQNTGVMQRGPGGPVQSNVVPGLQASSSYYSNSTGGQTGYFQQPGNSTLQTQQMPQHQAGYGLQSNMFGMHSQSHTSAGTQNYQSQFLSAQMQMAAATAMTAQQYRSPNMPNAAYMKSMSNQQMSDQSGRQQLKSPAAQQDSLSSVFNSGPQIPSPKSRQTCKQPPPQPSPTAQHKYLYQGVSSQQSGQARYPAPIQRPITYQQPMGSVQNSGPNKHRNNNNANSNSNNRSAARQYYGQGAHINNQNDKTEEPKLGDNAIAASANLAAKAAASSGNQLTEKGDKEENSAISKD